ncbi:hypothetical protein G6F56_012101 [Rhizopus delemar]|nr:hypothetical protein G6F56_012101 [Rhizopus delemar]
MYGPGSPTNTPSQNNRIEPSFFHTSNSQKNSPKKQGLGQEPAENPYWPSPPPYSERPSASNSSTPSAPPLDLAQDNNARPYPAPIYPPSDPTLALGCSAKQY